MYLVVLLINYVVDVLKIQIFFFFLFSNVGYQTWNSQNAVRIANTEDPGQTASSEEV